MQDQDQKKSNRRKNLLYVGVGAALLTAGVLGGYVVKDLISKDEQIIVKKQNISVEGDYNKHKTIDKSIDNSVDNSQEHNYYPESPSTIVDTTTSQLPPRNRTGKKPGTNSIDDTLNSGNTQLPEGYFDLDFSTQGEEPGRYELPKQDCDYEISNDSTKVRQ